MAPYTNMPDDVAKAMADDTEAKIKSGELHPFKGPITKQDGTRRRSRTARPSTTARSSA